MKSRRSCTIAASVYAMALILAGCSSPSAVEFFCSAPLISHVCGSTDEGSASKKQRARAKARHRLETGAAVEKTEQEKLERARQLALAVQEKHQREYAEWIKHPHMAKAKALGPHVNGALVCADGETVQYLFRAITNSSSGIFHDVPAGGEKQAARQSLLESFIGRYDCALVPAGTQVLVTINDGATVISANVNDRVVRGVTLPNMIAYDEIPPDEAAGRPDSHLQ